MSRARFFAQRRARRTIQRGEAPRLYLPGMPPLGILDAASKFRFYFIVFAFIVSESALARTYSGHIMSSLVLLWLGSIAWWIISSIRAGQFQAINPLLRSSYALIFATFASGFMILLEQHAKHLDNISYVFIFLGTFFGAWRLADWVLYALEGRPVSIPFSLPHLALPSFGRSKNFGLWIGEATGHLASLNHHAGIKRGNSVVLSLPDAAQNVLILGGIGSGKTTRAVNPLLLQLLDQQCGGLIFNVKGNFGTTVDELAHETRRTVVRIGPGHEPMHLLAGLTPEVAASFLKSAFLLGGTPRDGFWIDTATELCRNALGVLSFFPDRYGLNALYRYLFDPKTRAAWNAEAKEELVELRTTGRDRDARLLEAYLAYHEDVFGRFEDRLRSNVNAQVAQALSPFNHPDLADAFCSASGVAMDPVLDGTVYLVELPLARYGLGAKVAYTFVKLRFFNVVQRRRTEPTWNQDRPMFFVCDEYQEIISAAKDSLSDLTFWDKARESGCVGIIASQSVSSFYAAIGDRDVTKTVLQNFRQVLCFRTEDDATISRLVELLGQVEVGKIHQNRGHSYGQDRVDNHGSTLSWHRQNVIDPQLFREMGPDQALALLSIGGRAYDDVLHLCPVYAGT